MGSIGKTSFVNDSKATNADAAAKALVGLSRYLLDRRRQAQGGRHRKLGDLFGRVRRAYLIGEAAHEFARTLDGKAPYVMAGTLEKAVELAAADAEAGTAPAPVVLLSPACASFDQFKDFEQRGEAFRAAVAKLQALRVAS